MGMLILSGIWLVVATIACGIAYNMGKEKGFGEGADMFSVVQFPTSIKAKITAVKPAKTGTKKITEKNTTPTEKKVTKKTTVKKPSVKTIKVKKG